MDQILKLFTLNDFNKESTFDDSLSLLNKKNIDKIMQFLSYEDSIKYINENLHINNFDEAKNLRDYLDYLCGDVAFRFSKGGTKGIGAIADFLSQGFSLLFNQMGDDLFFGVFVNKLFYKFFKYLKCEDFLQTYIFDDVILKDLIENKKELIKNNICLANKSFIYSLEENYNRNLRNYNTEDISNTRIWIENILYKKKDLQTVMSLTDLEWTLLTRDNSLIVKKFAEFANEIMVENNVQFGNYRVFNRIKIAANQWALGIVTINTNNTDSVKEWRNDHYKSKVEFSYFCKNFYPDNCNDISSDDIFQIAKIDKLFNSNFISDLFIEYYNNKQTENKFAKKYFIDYLRYFMFHEVLNIFVQKSAKDLMWGWEDEFLNLIVN